MSKVNKYPHFPPNFISTFFPDLLWITICIAFGLLSMWPMLINSVQGKGKFVMSYSKFRAMMV